jgi:hypothetical protein
MKYASATVSGLITAPCETLFDIVSDPTRHPELAGSGEVQDVKWITPPPIGVGSAFQSHQKINWYQYPTRSYVQVYEPPYRFVWLTASVFKKLPFGQLWGFDLQPVDARSTIVSNLMKVPFPLPPLPPFTWIVDAGAQHEVDNMRPTFNNLARMANAHLIGELQVKLEWCMSALPHAERGQSGFRTASA